MNKLIPLSDFVLEQKYRVEKSPWQSTVESSMGLIFNYTNFLKQPLKLGMLVPVDKNGDPIILSERGEISEHERVEEQNEYFKSQESVLFECDLRIDRTPYKQTKRFLIDLLVEGFSIRIYTELQYHNGEIDKQYFPNCAFFKIEDLVSYGLTLTPSALKQIGVKE